MLVLNRGEGRINFISCLFDLIKVFRVLLVIGCVWLVVFLVVIIVIDC